MKYRSRLARMEKRVEPKFSHPPMLIFVTAPGGGYNLSDGQSLGRLVTEEEMNKLCAELPPNAPIPMVLITSNSKAKTEAESASVE